MNADQTLFPDFPDDARVWVYAADRPIGDGETARLLDALGPFLEGWTSHRRSVRGGAEVIEGRFLVIAATSADGDLSGCGIDKSVHRVEEAGRELGLGWTSALDVAWRAGDGSVCVATRRAFRQAAADGSVDGDTRVFDLSVETLGALRTGAFERRAADSWHGRVFGLDTAVDRA